MEFSLTVESSGLDALQERLQHFPEWVDGITRDAVSNDIEPAILPEAQVEPGPVKRPIAWSSEKQRRFVMAKVRKNGPYVRTHALSRGWQFTVTTTPGEGTLILMDNPTPYFTFVEGLSAQPFHRNTGWMNAPDDKFAGWGASILSIMGAALQSQWGAAGQ